MANIAYYDIDTWHRGKSVPNLELCKMYSYHYKNNDKVTMLRPQDLEDIERFSQIIFFKEDPITDIPRNLKLVGPNISLIGYGFYRIPPVLSEQYSQEKPNYFLYDVYSTKMSRDYNNIKNSSYIRFATNDFSDYSSSKKLISIADYNFFGLDGSFDFIHDNLNKHNFFFVRGLRFNNEEKLIEAYRFKPAGIKQKFYVDYKFTMKTLEYTTDDVPLFDWVNNLYGESNAQHLLRIATMIIFYKSYNKSIYANSSNNNSFANYLIKWGMSTECISYEKFYKNNTEALNYMITAPAQLRFLLKINPKELHTQNIDLNDNLWYN